MDEATKAKLGRYGKGLLRAMVAGGVVYITKEATDVAIAGIPLAGVLAMVGKFLRDKFPGLSWLPF